MDATEPGMPAEQDDAPPPAPSRRGGGHTVLFLAVLVLCLATAAPVLDQLWQIVVARLGLADDTPSYDHVWLVLNALPELRLQLAILAVLAGIAGAAFGHRMAALVAVFCAVVNVGVIVQSIDAWRGVAPEDAGPALRIMTFNINAFNAKRAAAVDAIRAGGADLVVVQEAAGSWPKALDALRRDYRHVAPADVARSQGMMIFSRYPILNIEQFQPISEYYPYLVATLQLPSATLTLISMHPPRPLRIGESVDRDVYFSRVADHVQALDGPVVVAGDLTAVPWSRPFRDMVRRTRLTSAWSLRPWLSTWPSWAPYVGLPLDQILVNEDAAITAVGLGDSAGSDHFPVIATVRLRDD
jgi:endonuclease/exonuclease/phosphatase (EEP) superfamily protein YafD